MSEPRYKINAGSLLESDFIEISMGEWAFGYIIGWDIGQRVAWRRGVLPYSTLTGILPETDTAFGPLKMELLRLAISQEPDDYAAR
jgi:hypothetical protein